jgi:hypothetical protein
LELKGHSGAIVSIGFDPTGRRLVTGSADGTAIIWNLERAWAKRTAARIPLDPLKLEDVWKNLADANAEKAHRAILASAADLPTILPLLRGRLKPAKGPDQGRIHALIRDLNAPKFSVREQARRELMRLGEATAEALREAARIDPAAEVRRLARTILDSIAYRPVEGEDLRTLRVLELLEFVGRPDAVELLTSLSQGAPIGIPTLEARKALSRLNRSRP